MFFASPTALPARERGSLAPTSQSLTGTIQSSASIPAASPEEHGGPLQAASPGERGIVTEERLQHSSVFGLSI